MLSPSPLSPQQQEDELQFSHDNHFALHGLITLLVVLFVFFLFIVFIFIIPFLKRRSSSSSSSAATTEAGRHEDEAEDSNVAERTIALSSRHRDEDYNPTHQAQTGLISSSSSEVISRKFPL